MGMHPDIEKLLQLQAKDVALLQADRALDLVLAEIEALDQQLAQQGTAVERARQLVAETTRRRAETDEKIANYRKLEERGKQRLESVRVPRELQAVNTELDLARSILAKEEAEWLRLSEQLGSQEKALGEAEAQLGGFRESRWRSAMRPPLKWSARCGPGTSGFAPTSRSGWWSHWRAPPAGPATPPCRSTAGARSAPAP
jgi:chromosome segregation ATPase